MKVYAYIDEIFSSIQGEGPFVGLRQIFIRFLGCQLNCRFCDTAAKKSTAGFCHVEKNPGKRNFYLLPNPFSPKKLNRILSSYERQNPRLHHSLSLTGGEPLEQVDFLKAWLPMAKKIFKVYLETNGVLPRHLSKIIKYTDWIAMDIKLPSSTKQGSFWEEHRDFLRVAKGRQIFVKAVITSDTDRYELLKAAVLVARVNKNIPFILQPVTPSKNIKRAPAPRMVLALQESLSSLLNDIRIIPQVHKLTGQL